MSKSLRVLIVEDSEDDELLLLRVLRRGGYDLIYQRVETAPAMIEALKEPWDIIISDYSMPQFSAPQALQTLKDSSIDIPFIIVSGTVGEDTAVAALKAGAHDFMLKGDMPRLVPTIERELREAAMRRAAVHAEEALRESEARYRSMFEETRAIKFIIAPATWAIVDANPTAAAFYGYSRDELKSKTIVDISLPPYEPLFEQMTHALSGNPAPFSFRHRLSSGATRDVEIYPNPLQIQGQTMLYCIIHDITERKIAENELAALYNATSFLLKADSLSNLGQQIVQAVVQEFDQVDCGLLLVDKTENKMNRLTRGGEYGVNTDTVLYLDGEGLVPEAVRGGKIVYASNTAEHPNYIANDSRTRSELVIPLKTSKGVLGVLDLQRAELDGFSQRDQRILSAFSERAAVAIEVMQLYEEINTYASELEKRVLERTDELERSKDHVEAILNNTSDAIILASYDGVILQVNPAFNRMLAYSSDEIFGHSLFNLILPDDIEVMLEALHTVVNTKQPKRIEMTVRRKDHTRFDADLAIAPITEDDKIRDIVCSLRDITERKRIEEELRGALEKEKELNELKTRFVSMVSHDFRTPLAIIQSSTDALQQFRDKMDDEQRDKRFTKIRAQIQRMILLLNDVLTISRADAGAMPFTPILLNLDHFCREIVEEFHNSPQTKHHINYICEDSTVEAMIDEKLLHQAVTNLLTNAFKYSPENTTVDFYLSTDDSSAILQIRDHGIGIPKEDQKHLFDPFHRANNVGTIEGTGLGLAIVKRSIDIHGGLVTFESEMNVGTTFTIRLPMESESTD